jgi:hypothetical protein
MLSLLASVANNLNIREAEALVVTLTALTSNPPLASTAPTFPSHLHALQGALIPLATAARNSQLTHGEAGAFARGVSTLLAESAWALNRMHVVLLTMHGPDTLVDVVTMTAAAIRFSPEPSAISPIILPHFRAAVARRMLAHHALTDVATKYDAVPVLIEAMHTCISDLQLEHDMIPESFRTDLQILPVSASYRYGMLVSTLQRLWKLEYSSSFSSFSVMKTPRTPRAAPITPRTPSNEKVLLYDGLLQQLEDTFQDLHLLMLDLGVTELVDDAHASNQALTSSAPGHSATAARGASDRSPAEPGSITFLPCKVRLTLL